MIIKIQRNNFSVKIIGKIIIIIAIIALTSSAIYILSKQIKKINISITEKKDMDYLINNQELVNNNIRVDFLSVDPTYQEKITAALPPVFNILPFVDSVESLSKKYSFTETMNFNQPIFDDTTAGALVIDKIGFNLNIVDINAENFILFLKDFEKLPYFASIDSISYVGTSKTGWQDNSSINIVGSLYAQN